MTYIDDLARDVHDLQLRLTARENLLRSVATALDAMACGVFCDNRDELCRGLAERIRTILDPQIGKATGRR
jgi:hypothetical protein